MKATVKLLGFVGLVAGSLVALAQDNPSATTAAPPAVAAPEAVVAAVPAPEAAAVAAPAPEAVAPAPDPGGVIPLIQYVDVPLTTAMDNLARQAGLNYILDPKVGFGQPGPDGKPMPQPTISVRWENLTAQQALTAMLNNYDLQIVEDPKTKIARISKKDPAAPDPLVTKIIQLKYSSASNMLASVQSSLSDKRSKVVPDIRTSQLVVLATEKEMVAVDELIARLDTRSKQVLIEAQLMEVSMSPSTKKGINWSSTFKDQNVSFGNGITSGSTITKAPGTPTTTTLPGGRTITTAPGSSEQTTMETLFGGLGGGGLSLNTLSGLTPAIGFLNADGLKATLSFFNEQADTKVLSTPRTVTLDNEPTFIEVGTMHPIVNVSAGTANTSGGSSIAYTNLTIRLDVTPSISANDFVNLKVHPSVMRLGPKIATKVADQNNVVDSFYKRDMETRVLIPSGNTLVLGGLVTDELINEGTKVPILGDIPFLGYAFRSSGKSRDKRNLVVFITPTIVQDEDFRPSKSTFLKTPLPAAESLEPDWAPFDSITPADWSKPDPYKLDKSSPQQPAVYQPAMLQPSAAQPPAAGSVAFDDSLIAPKP